MNYADIMGEAFVALNNVKTELSNVVTTLHEDGYHDYATRVSNLRLKVEDLESEAADLYEVIQKGAQK